MSAPRTRHYRRVPKACNNCRRKKVRCPGEKPRCSACTRLHQQCSFAEVLEPSEDSANRIDTYVNDRLEQLEDKLDTLMSRVVTPLPAEAFAKSIEFYFKHLHRQPLWLFDEHALSPSEMSEDLVCAILALSTTYNALEFRGEKIQSPGAYNKNARKGVMFKIAEGNMTVQSTQALCLLAYFSLITGDIAMAGFDISLANSMIPLLSDRAFDPNSSPHSQERSKLFWSIQFLGYACGNPAVFPSISNEADNPLTFVTGARNILTSSIPPPPRAALMGVHETLPDIWTQSLKICSLWADLRVYVARCLEGSAKHPWLPDSDYVRLCSKVLEVEAVFPVALSYNAVKFSQMPAQSVQEHRRDLLPWVRVQTTYHTIHCILNHPSLHTVMAETPKNRLGANTFWRSSYEKALRHCTWISRLIRISDEKGLRLTDPFFAQAAAIAGTLHLYWTRGGEITVQESSMKHLDVCMKLVKEMATFWPVCQTIETALRQFIDSHQSMWTQVSGTRQNFTRTSLIWILLDVAAPQFPDYHNQASLGRAAWVDDTSFHNDHEIPSSEMSSPPIDMRESTAHYASPPHWVAEGSEEGTHIEHVELETRDTTIAHREVAGDHVITNDFAWGPWENLGLMERDFVMNTGLWDMN
ncbi:hypothetical protein FHETE_9033 [Fusarium heterosporum]|uniref:Zn(2)-C6 fungal-type domain-containing protein n=1 Tax=Fusarium heterosporum TaxID=42747 RepID=A0A8H5T026_FUSHE|nr:hypothetical protein FHETE_9033 [Fusarium heterosporum]